MHANKDKHHTRKYTVCLSYDTHIHWTSVLLTDCHNCAVHVHLYLHGHFKLIQPFLLQLSGLEKEFKARVPLLVSHVEPIAPL